MLAIKELTCTIGHLEVLRGINLQIDPHESIGLIGPNGSGKTTLFNCISGFSKSIGSITFLNTEINSLPAAQRSRQGLGRTFQNSGIFREMTVLENMIIALESRQKISSLILPRRSTTAKYRALAFDQLERVKLASLSEQKAGSLSGGQMRLLEIARMLAFGAELLLLDEPSAGVSPRMKDEIAEILLSLKQCNKTILIIEHDINFIQRLCDRIIVMDSGQIVLQGTPEEVRNSPYLQDIYFGKGLP